MGPRFDGGNLGRCSSYVYFCLSNMRFSNKEMPITDTPSSLHGNRLAILYNHTLENETI